MTERLKRIFAEIPICKVFADVGCDHGYIAKAMIDSRKCEKVVISDISEQCLSKAQKLLREELANDKALSIVTDGLKDLPYCDCVLIAGMGGEEIVKIIINSPFLPEKFVLQPMKNAEKVLSSEGKTNSLPALQAEYSHQISAIAVMIIGYKSADNICRQVFFNRF